MNVEFRTGSILFLDIQYVYLTHCFSRRMPLFFKAALGCAMEINPLLNSLKDIRARNDVLRGYL